MSASRAHHAEIGGIPSGLDAPGRRRRLAEEGVVLPPTLSGAGRRAPQWDEIFGSVARTGRRVAVAGGPEDNLADLRAAVAANHAGAPCPLSTGRGSTDSVRTVQRLHGDRLERAGCRADRARPSSAIGDGRLPGGPSIWTTARPWRVRDRDRAGDGRTSTSPAAASVHPGNLNATPAIVQQRGDLRACVS